MVVSIDEFRHKVHQAAFRVTKVAAPLSELGPEQDDKVRTTIRPAPYFWRLRNARRLACASS